MTRRKPTKLQVLRSESAADFLALRKRLDQEVKPKGVIEEMYLEEIANRVWDIKRLRGFRISTSARTCGPALRRVLEQLLFEPWLSAGIGAEEKAGLLASGWLANGEATKKEVADILSRFDLDESAIEAEAMSLTVDHLQYLDRSLLMSSARLDKALRMVVDYQSSFATRVRAKADQILNDNQNHETAKQKAAA